MPFVVYEADWFNGTRTNPKTFLVRDDARDYALELVEGWREGSDWLTIEGGRFLVFSESGLLDFGAIIVEVPDPGQQNDEESAGDCDRNDPSCGWPADESEV